MSGKAEIRADPIEPNSISGCAQNSVIRHRERQHRAKTLVANRLRDGAASFGRGARAVSDFKRRQEIAAEGVVDTCAQCDLDDERTEGEIFIRIRRVRQVQVEIHRSDGAEHVRTRAALLHQSSVGHELVR